MLWQHNAAQLSQSDASFAVRQLRVQELTDPFSSYCQHIKSVGRLKLTEHMETIDIEEKGN